MKEVNEARILESGSGLVVAKSRSELQRHELIKLNDVGDNVHHSTDGVINQIMNRIMSSTVQTSAHNFNYCGSGDISKDVINFSFC